MGVDLRIGKRDYFTRYRVYKTKPNINNKIEWDSECLGILHAKDITSYDTTPQVDGNVFRHDETIATIETNDRIEIKPDYLLFALAEQCWYIVESASVNSHNETQRWSSRPINTTTIVIRKEI